MDIFAHAVWTNILARAVKRRQQKREKILLKLGWTTFWGVFPDLFAFVIPIIVAIPALITSGFSAGRHAAFATVGLPATLYLYSHSLVIWAVVFIIVWIINKRPRWELLGWALHVLIDIPSHANGFYLTPFLWPLSNYRFTHGISWAHPIYMITNYSALFVAWGGLIIYKWRNKKSAHEIV